MANLILLEVPGGNDFAVLEDAVTAGHTVTFCTGDLDHYRRQGPITERALSLAHEVIEVKPFDYARMEARLHEAHRARPFDAVICMIDIRLVEASDLAHSLGLRFLNRTTARLLRDKFEVRKVLARKQVRQPRFSIAETVPQLRQAVDEVGFPVLVKPADGYGSQNVTTLSSAAELDAYIEAFARYGEKPTDYGFGVSANRRFCVESYIRGAMIGCDVFSNSAGRTIVGINDKLMFPPPSFAMRGSCFPSRRYNRDLIESYVREILDAVDFDFGAAHIEMIVAPDGPYLVEINPRLVSAQIPYQIGYAFERSIYADLFNLHLGLPIDDAPYRNPPWFSAIRWITAPRAGVLAGVRLPDVIDPLVRRVALFKEPGDPVRPPLANGDRIGYAIAVGKTQETAEHLADSFVRHTAVDLH